MTNLTNFEMERFVLLTQSEQDELIQKAAIDNLANYVRRLVDEGWGIETAIDTVIGDLRSGLVDALDDPDDANAYSDDDWSVDEETGYEYER